VVELEPPEATHHNVRSTIGRPNMRQLVEGNDQSCGDSFGVAVFTPKALSRLAQDRCTQRTLGRIRRVMSVTPKALHHLVSQQPFDATPSA